MAKGKILRTAIFHSEVRRLHAEKIKELGDMAKWTAKSYFVWYIALKKNYSESSVKAILNRKKKDIPENEFDLN